MLVMTMFMQKVLHAQPVQAGLVFVPLALAFVAGSRGARARRRGTRVLIEGCLVQVAGLGALALMVAVIDSPPRCCWRWPS